MPFFVFLAFGWTASWVAYALPQVGKVASSEGESKVFTFEHTLEEGRDRMLLVAVSMQKFGEFANAVELVRYGDIVMHPLPGGMVVSQGAKSFMSTQLFYLLDHELPAAGNYPIKITQRGYSTSAGAMTLFGVAQRIPQQIKTAVFDEDTPVRSKLVVDVAGSLLVDVVMANHDQTFGLLRPDSAQQLSWDANGRVSQSASSSRLAGKIDEYSMAWRWIEDGKPLQHALQVSLVAEAADVHGNSGDDGWRPLTLKPVDDVEMFDGDTKQIVLQPQGGSGVPLNFSVSKLPEFVSLKHHGDGSAELLIEPFGDKPGKYNFTVSVTDGVTSASNLVTIQLAP